MALGKDSHLSMRRIVAIAIIAIVFPSLVLTLVGLKLTLDLKSQLEQSLADQYASEVAAKAEEIEDRVATLEAKIKRAADRLEPDQIQPTLDALARDTLLVDEIFLLDARLTVLYPPELEPAETVAETLMWAEPFPPAVRQAHEARSPGDVLQAIDALNRHRERTVSPAARVRTTQAIAALLFRYGQYEEAAKEYQRLLQADNAAVFSPSLAALARYQIALASRELGRAPDAVSALLDLYADLVRGKTRVADADRVAWFKRRVSADVEALLARPDVARPESRRYAALLEEEQQRRSRARLLGDLRRFILPRIERRAPSLTLDTEGFQHLWEDELADQPYLVAYTAVRGHDDTKRILGFSIGLEYIRYGVLPQALRTSRFGRNVGFVVASREGARLFGSGADPVAATTDFPAIFKAWQLGLVEREPVELRRLARRNVYLFAFVTSAMIIAIILGVVITLRGTARELEISQLKSDFVSNVSHELKTPLALIRMFAETLELGRVKSEAKLREYYSIITRESERLTQLINNVLDFSRIEGGRKTYDLRLDDATDVIHDTLHAFSYELDKQGFEVDMAIADGVPDTLMDRNAISLAILNLLSNAVKYSTDDKRIRVGCAARNGYIDIAVTDHGIGIDTAQVDKVFDKFYRVPDDHVEATRGSGLGLAIVRHSIEAHGGTITVQSEKGEGSTFTISLPIRQTLTDGERR